MDTIQTVVRSILKKESLDDCSVEELQSLAQQYPYFSAVQFLLAEKLRSADEHLYRQQLQKLSLHFSNPLWLDYLLNGYDEQIATQRLNGTGADEALIVTEPIDSEAPASFIKSESEISAPNAEEIAEAIKEDPLSDTEPNREHMEAPAPAQEATVEEPAPATTEHTNDISDLAENFASSQQDEQTTEVRVEAPEGISDRQQPEEEINPPAIPIPQLPKMDEVSAEAPLTFEPYHTVDYFASQGIKFVPEEKPADHFGKQLKSFTEWLKTMKRLPQSEVIKSTDPSSERKVQQLADHSITEEEIVTETMAEVWVKQGNTEKAIETYNKLSLLNPGKSAYFASLVEQLKNS